MLLRISFSIASLPAMVAWIIGVSVLPGHTALIRTPVRAFSTAAVFVRPSTACFEAQ